jgi:hypothetical protein
MELSRPPLVVAFELSEKRKAIVADALAGASAVVYLTELDEAARAEALCNTGALLTFNTSKELRSGEAALLDGARLAACAPDGGVAVKRLFRVHGRHSRFRLGTTTAIPRAEAAHQPTGLKGEGPPKKIRTQRSETEKSERKKVQRPITTAERHPTALPIVDMLS